MTTLELLRAFLKAFFVEHHPERGLAMVTEDILCYGLTEDDEPIGMAALTAMAETVTQDRFAAAEWTVEKEKQITEDMAVLHYQLRRRGAVLRGRITGSSRSTLNGRRLYFLSITITNPRQSLCMRDDAARVKRVELAGHDVSGGMMGAYLSPGFPFYYINEHLLRCLGYADEAEFVQRIQGRVENCICPEDREAVRQSLSKQSADTGTYELDYRMQRKDGSLLWVHGVGKRIVAEDGRAAMLWVCGDITSDKAHEHILEGLMNSLNGKLTLVTDSAIQNKLQLHALSQNATGIAVVDADSHETYFMNDSMFHMLGMTPVDCAGKPCPELLRGCGGSCDDCGISALKENGSLDRTVELNGRWLSFHTERRAWAGRSVMSIYASDVTEKVQLQTRLEDIFENMPSAVCLYRWHDHKLDRLLIGKGFNELFGSGAQKLMDSDQNIIFDIVHPDDVAGVRTHIGRFLSQAGNGEGSCQYRAWNADKQAYLWTSLHVRKVQQRDGSCLIYAVFTNDTEQVALKNQLIATRTAINAAVQYGQLGLWQCELSTNRILQNLSDMSVNGSEGERFDTVEALIAQRAIHEEDRETYLHCYQALQNGARHSDCVVRVLNHSEQAYRWAHIYLVRQPEVKGEPPTAIGMSFDVDREITSYQQLQEMQRQLELEKQATDDLFENLPGGLVMYRWDGQALQPGYVSEGSSAFFGEDGGNGLQRANGLIHDAVHPEDLPKLEAFIAEQVKTDGQTLIDRYRVWNKQRNAYVWIQLSGNVKHLPDGTAIVYANFADVDAEVEAAEKIRREDQLLETTCRLAHIWMFFYNLQEHRAYPSQMLQEDYHLPPVLAQFPDSFLIYPVIPQENRSLYRQMIQRVDAGEDATTEMQVLLPDGTRRYVRYEWHITRREEGETVEVAGLAIDITREIDERKRIESERQRLLGEGKKLVAYSITDLQKEMVIEAKDISLCSGISGGETCAEFNAKVAPFLRTEQDRQRFFVLRDPSYALQQHEKGILEWTEDLNWRPTSGQNHWRRSVYAILENGSTGALYLYCYLYDVTEEKIAQALFAGIQENLYLRTAVLSCESGILYTYTGEYPNRTLKPVAYSHAIHIYAQNEVLPEDAAIALEQGSMANVKAQLSAGTKGFSFVHRLMEGDALRYRQVRYVSVPGDEDTKVIVIRDVTDLIEESERRNLELQQALTAANAATRAKSEFLSRMSHEIRTPMNAIMGMTAIAQDNKSDFLQVTDCLSKIDSSSRYLLTLINDILEMSRIESGRMKLTESDFSFADLMEQLRIVVEPLALKSRIRLEMVNKTSNGSYFGDSIRIQQVMINLLGNAIKFTKPGGRVRFMVAVAEEADTTTTFEFTVEDTGIGMSKAYMKSMFEPFSQEDSTNTSQYGGSGLGLAISRSLVELMGGTITAESMVGIGTTFTVRIPLGRAQGSRVQRTAQAEEMPEALQDALLTGRRILMAEDHPMNIMIAKKLLERKRMLVTVAENGRLAVDCFRSSAVNEFDAILMDIRMPVMDGLEAARQIRALDRPDAATVPMIAMTANALAEDRRNTKEAGMDAHLSKPIEPQMLYQTLAMQLRRKRT